MQSSVKKLPKSRVRISISINADEFAEHFEHALGHFVETAKLPGFRQGKAPRALILQQVGQDAVMASAIDHAVPDAYYKAVLEHKLHPLAQPNVAIEKATDGLQFSAEVDCMPEVKVKDWKAIKVKPTEAEAIKEADVDKVLQSLRKQRAELLEVSRPLRNGDFATVSYTGSLDHVTQESMTSQNHPIVVGEGTLIPGFEANLVDMEAGQSKSFPITFPKDYHEKSLQGKKAEFSVTLDAMKELQLPAVDEAFAKEFGQESVAALQKGIQAQLESESSAAALSKTQDAVLHRLIERTVAEVPEVVMEEETDRIMESYMKRLGLESEQFDMYLEKQNKTKVGLRKEMAEQANHNALIGLALGAIMDEQSIDPHEKESVPKVLDLLMKSATEK